MRKKARLNIVFVTLMSLSLILFIPVNVFNPFVVAPYNGSGEIPRRTSRFSSIVSLSSNSKSPSTTSTPQLLSPSSNDVNLYADSFDQDEPTISLNPTNPRNLAAGSHDESNAKPSGTTLWTISYRSLDGGTTWSQGYVPHTGPLAQFTRAGDPVVDFDGFGQAYYGGVAFVLSAPTTDDLSVWVAKSRDGGLTYDTPVMVDEGYGNIGSPFYEANDKPWITTDKRTTGTGAGYLYMTWTKFVDTNGDGVEDSYHIVLSRSTDGGTTFSTPIQVSDAANWANQLSQVAIGPNGEVYVSWINWNLPNTRILFDKSTNYGVSFGTDIQVQSFNDIPNLQFIYRTPPSIAMTVDTGGGAYNGNIYIAYPIDPTGGDSSNMMFTRSINGGVSWSPPIRLNDDTTMNDQFFPAINVNALGHINVAWYDRRLDSGDRYIDVFSTKSIDGGSSFTANVRVTDTSFDPAGQFIGDYIDIDANNVKAYPIWTDRRNGNNDVYIDGPTHDVAVVNVTPTKTVVGQSYLTFINATVENQGDTIETFDITAYANATIPVAVQTQTVTLDGGVSTYITFTWNTTDFAKGNYTVSVYANPVPSETDMVDNSFEDGIVKVVTPGDVNADGIVDLFDAAGVSAHWYPGPPIGPLGYGSNFDINNDGSINIQDAALVSAYWTGPPKGPLG